MPECQCLAGEMGPCTACQLVAYSKLRTAATKAMIILRDCEALSVNFRDEEAFALDNAAEAAYVTLKTALAAQAGGEG